MWWKVKGIALESVRSVQPGGAIEIAYRSGLSRKDPSKQASRKMFDIKDVAQRRFGGEMNVPFQFWVAFPRISRAEWEEKFGEAVSGRTDVLFSDDLESSHLGHRLCRKGSDRLRRFDMKACPSRQLASVMYAFGDSGVLESREPRPVDHAIPEGTRREHLESDLADHRKLTEQQQKLALQDWNEGPRLIRGVAGSGKTVVMATQVARAVERKHDELARGLFDAAQAAPILVVCFNRTLVPFIKERIASAYRQRTTMDIPERALVVTHYNTLLYFLSRRRFCTYRTVDTIDLNQNAALCLEEFEKLTGEKKEQLSAGLFDAVFVDEGQDFHHNEFRVLLELCAKTNSGRPRIFVFYDDAQNLYARRKPDSWADLGLEIAGRSTVMEQSYRSPRSVIEPAFNVLLGTYSDKRGAIGMRGFADIQTLKAKNLVTIKNRHVGVDFAVREGEPVALIGYASRQEEAQKIAGRCEQLIKQERLLPQDILVLTHNTTRGRELAKAIEARLGAGKVRCAFEENEKDQIVIQPDRVTVSTIASAKGYDAPQVLLASLEDLNDDPTGRASFYVGCTRAREWLEVSGSERSPFFEEMRQSIDATAGRNCVDRSTGTRTQTT